MKALTLFIVLMLLTACGEKKEIVTIDGACTIEDTHIVCPDGSKHPLPQDGRDGADGGYLTSTVVPRNSCTEVLPGLFVESIMGGSFFDVYYNDTCSDVRGEYCDNMEPSFGSSGDFGHNKPGGAEVCWADNRMVSGERIGDDLLIRVVEF